MAVPRALLTPEAASPKLTHRVAGHVATIMYLAPVDLSGARMCSHASPGCAGACLYHAGRSEWSAESAARIGAARIDRTRWLVTDPVGFFSQLVRELDRHERYAVARGLVPAARLNGTSDFPWERIPVVRGGVPFPSIFAAFPGVRFYDYTKVATRALRYASAGLPVNYHLTFSLSESNDRDAVRVLEAGGSVTVVVRGGYAALPVDADGTRRWSGYVALDGDGHDLRYLDPGAARLAGVDHATGYVVVLKPKGRNARGSDAGGFFRDPLGALDRDRVPVYVSAGAASPVPRVRSIMAGAIEAAGLRSPVLDSGRLAASVRVLAGQYAALDGVAPALELLALDGVATGAALVEARALWIAARGGRARVDLERLACSIAAALPGSIATGSAVEALGSAAIARAWSILEAVAD